MADAPEDWLQGGASMGVATTVVRYPLGPDTTGESLTGGCEETMERELLKVFKALSDETRLRILKLLERGAVCVCDIVAVLGTSQPRVSFHIAVLKDAGLVRDRKAGRWTHYSLDDSDVFRRFLLLSIMERAKGEVFERDLQKMSAFQQNKTAEAGDPMAACRAACG
jgi:ArsR family transcriptional regulator